MKRLLYYCMLFLFFVCFVWNALSKKDSIMGTPDLTTQVEQREVPNDLALVGSMP
jgi:hypothetical protein